MRYRLRHLDLDDKMCHQISLDVFEHVYPRHLICEQLSLHQGWEKRERVLNMLTIVYLLLAAAFWTRLAFPRVLERLGRPLHLLGLSLGALHPSPSQSKGGGGFPPHHHSGSPLRQGGQMNVLSNVAAPCFRWMESIALRRTPLRRQG